MIDHYYLKSLEARIEKLEKEITQKTNNDDFDFSVGQTVYFYHTEYGRHCWGNEDTIVFPTELKLFHGRICKINPASDRVEIEVANVCEPIITGYIFFHEWFFKSKEDALQAMFKKLDEIGMSND